MNRKIKGCIVISAMLFLTACGSKQGEQGNIIELKESTLNEPQVTTVIRDDLEVYTALDAQVGPYVEQLSFAEDGVFGEYKVKLGDEVKEGDVLATTYSEDLQEQVENKQKELDDLTVQYEYQKATLENDIAILEIRMEDVNSQLEKTNYGTYDYSQLCVKLGNYDESKKKKELQLKHLKETYDLELPYVKEQLANLQKKHTQNQIVAPFDGVIVALEEISANTAVSKNSYYVAIADTDIFYARCENISQSMVNAMKKVVFWCNGNEYEAVYEPIEDSVFIEMQNNGEMIYASFRLQEPDANLVHGAWGKIKLVSTVKEDVLLVPQSAIASDAAGRYVYAQVDGARQKVYITTQSSDGIMMEVTGGLAEGDVVYVQE